MKRIWALWDVINLIHTSNMRSVCGLIVGLGCGGFGLHY